MTTISATSLLASQHVASRHRVDTLLLRYPRCIHAEFLTHRVFSKNSASSRAIPIDKMIQDVVDNPFVPLHWGKNEKGMQAGMETDALVYGNYNGLAEGIDREHAWLLARDDAILWARRFRSADYHKQIVNRLLEPWAHITVVVSSTRWRNFFALRDHEDAEPHIRLLAQAIRKARDEATVQVLKPGEWHLPFVSPEERAGLALDASGQPLALKVSVARCASTSYKTVDGFDMTIGRAIELHDKLAASNPMHASPMEHQCYADRNVGNEVDGDLWARPKLWGNFQAFCQYRRVLEVGA